MFTLEYQAQAERLTISISPGITGRKMYQVVNFSKLGLWFAFVPGLLRDLKGPAVSVLLAMAKFANRRGSAYPSIDTLAEETGYSRPSVVKGVEVLVNRGLVDRVRRQRETTLYIIKPFHLPLLTLEEQAERAEKKAARKATRQKIKQDVMDNVVKVVGKVEEAAESVVEALAPADVPSVAEVDSPLATVTVEQVEDTSTEVAQEEKGEAHTAISPEEQAEWDIVLEKLVKLGVLKPVAIQLIEIQRTAGRSSHYVDTWTVVFKDGMLEKKINGIGWLVAALRNDWDMPESYQEMAMTEYERRMSYLEDEFSHIIEH